MMLIMIRPMVSNAATSIFKVYSVKNWLVKNKPYVETTPPRNWPFTDNVLPDETVIP